jgi:hypothetical protein
MSNLSTKLPLDLLLTQWSTILTPVINNPILKGYAIKSIVMAATTPRVIPIGLGFAQQGWFLTDNMASCNVWRTQPFNESALTLEASADTTISIWVF